MVKPRREKARSNTRWSSKDLIGLQGVPADEIRALLFASRAYVDVRSDVEDSVLHGTTIANLFFEDSTRTRTSFTTAAHRLRAHVSNLLGAFSSVTKGETLIDTARNVEAMGVRALVIRARQAGAAGLIAANVKCPVINAGDGRHEHPTQGLLDIYTLAEANGRLDDFDMKGLTVAIVGDIVSSRVARSNIAGLTALGARVICVGPAGLAPRSLESLGGRGGAVTVTHELDEVLPKVDAVMMLRVQFERHDGGADAQGKSSPAIASVREYRSLFGMTAERADRLKNGAVVMHPGPINRGIELDPEVADGPRSVILRQVTVGVGVRMAVLETCARALD
ncbi:MAG: aspartate carbamoyltransferase catalytic subunit [Phycisphaerae bacterium]|nr:aspartate carbamoyltransferase catalytic subunit [Phycisphaerae bacterium]MBN8596816.1 aspartate carbamoyltransferase catalytic subunit [Planctomycetota bacterium]